MSKSSPRYPVATVASYGPDNTLATKLVVAVVDKNGHLLDQRTWQTLAVDVRHDPVIAADVAGFIKQRGARETLHYDRIIGCPHEEGVDYPLGRACPTCHFWERINRFTHEPVIVAEPTMSAAEILAELSREHTVQPREALVSADGHRQALVDPLLRALERGIANPVDASEEEAALFVYALYLFAKWREPRAYPYVCRWLSLPRDEAFDLAGDVVTEDGPRILAAVCDGNLEPIKTLILNREADEYGRAEAINALVLLAAWAEVPRESVVTHLQWLAREGLEREYSYVWNGLASACADIEALPVFPELRRAFDDGLIAPTFMDLSELDDIEAAPRGERLERTQEERPPIDDVVEATAWWAVFADGPAGTDGEPGVPSPKVGRNEPCPCGSGKKYKKCHGA